MSSLFKDNATVWNLIKHFIKNYISPKDYKIWINKNTKLLQIKDNSIELAVNNQFTKKWVTEHALPILQQAVQDILNIKNPKITVTIKQELFKEQELQQIKGTILDPELIKANKLQAALKKAGLNSKYTFDTFIVGPSNQLAYASSVAVAESPGTAYNPLFIYGPVGTGKTHLLQAIGHKMLEKDSSLKVIYLTSEAFLNELVNSLRQKTTQQFRDKYRNVDLLIIDDIQFVSGWQTTQEELFHTFNALYQAGKQIVFASDRPPSEITDIAERLRSRFEGGMVVDIMPPDYETKIAILTKINQQNNNILPKEALDIIAEHLGYNIRQLIGAYNKVASYAKLLNKKITVKDVFIILKHEFKQKITKQVDPNQILQKVADYFSVDINKLLSNSRDANTALARQVAMYILRQELQFTLKDAAQVLNRKDHTTVIHAVNKITKLMQTDTNLKNKIMAISVEVKG